MKQSKATYEYREVCLPRSVPRAAACAFLTELAEYGKWELDRLRLYPDGRRRAWLRRRVMRVART